MLQTIHKINNILEEEGKTRNPENIISIAKQGGKHAFELIEFVHNKEIEHYKEIINKLNKEIDELKNKKNGE